MKTHQHALWISRYLIPLFCISLTSCTPPALPPENTLHDYLRSRIHSLDPIYAHDLYSTEVTAQIYEGLYQYHYLKRPLTIIPALAKGMPKVSQDQLTHTIKIKRNIFFHDHSVFPKGEGREVTAHDFVYSIKRVADPKNKSNGYWVYKNRILGLDKWRKQRAHQEIDFDSPIPGLFAEDKYTLVIRLTKPYYQLHHILTMPYAYVVPREGV